MPNAAAHASQPPAGQRVLVVEDAPVIGTLVRHFLAEHYDVTWAATLEEALEAATKRRFDAVLCNLTLGLASDAPSGRDVSQRLRALPAYHDVPIIALSGYLGTGAYKPHVISDEFDGWLGKPFSRAALLQVLERTSRQAA